MKELVRRNLSLLIILIAIILATASILTFGVGKGVSGGEAGGASRPIGKTLKIGLARIKSGPSAVYGEHADAGAELAIEEINESKLLGDVKIELVSEDTEGKSERATASVEKLIKQDKVAVIVGPQGSKEVTASSDIAQESAVPMISASATSEEATKAGDNIFSIAYTDNYQGGLLAKYIAKQGKKKVAILFNSDNPYSTGIKDSVREELKKSNVEVKEEGYAQDAKDFNGQLQSIKSFGADALVLPEEVGPIVPIGPQARAILGKNIPFYGVDGMGGITGIAKGDDFDNTYYVNSFATDAPEPRIQKFVEKFQKKTNKAPTFISVNTYDAIYLIADAYKNSSEKTIEGLHREIQKTNKEYVTGTIKFSANRFALKTAMIIHIKKENDTLVEKYQEPISA